MLLTNFKRTESLHFEPETVKNVQNFLIQYSMWEVNIKYYNEWGHDYPNKVNRININNDDDEHQN